MDTDKDGQIEFVIEINNNIKMVKMSVTLNFIRCGDAGDEDDVDELMSGAGNREIV